MVKAIVLPDNVVLEIKRERVKVKEIVEHLGESNLDYITVLVNDSLVKDLEVEVTSMDRIVIIKQPTGG